MHLLGSRQRASKGERQTEREREEEGEATQKTILLEGSSIVSLRSVLLRLETEC